MSKIANIMNPKGKTNNVNPNETNGCGTFTIPQVYSVYVNHIKKDNMDSIKSILVDSFSKTTPNNFRYKANTIFPERDSRAAISAYLEVLVSEKLDTNTKENVKALKTKKENLLAV